MNAATIPKKRIDGKELSMFDYTVDLLAALSDDELEAVQTVAITFLKKNSNTFGSRDSVSPFEPQSEEQLYARIDKSLSQIEEGQFQASEEVEEELSSRKKPCSRL